MASALRARQAKEVGGFVLGWVESAGAGPAGVGLQQARAARMATSEALGGTGRVVPGAAGGCSWWLAVRLVIVDGALAR